MGGAINLESVVQSWVGRAIRGLLFDQGSVVRSGVGLSIRSRSFDQAHHQAHDQGAVIWSSWVTMMGLSSNLGSESVV